MRREFSLIVLALLTCISLVVIPRAFSDDDSPRRSPCRGATLRAARSLCDADHDGLTNRQETRLRTRIFSRDTDKDGLGDGQEVKKYKTNPRKKDSDGDRLRDGREVKVLHTNPRKKDTDGDGLLDGLEVLRFRTNPRSTDTDGDGIVDGNDDSNGNGISDEDEDDRPGEGDTSEDLDDSLGNSCTVIPNPFDASGNTSSFGIPAGLSGNISAGQGRFTQSCKGCHATDKGTNLAFPRLKAAVQGAPMFLTSITDQQISDLVAYLNRTNIPPTPRPDCNLNATPTPSPGGSPTATPTPQSGSCTPIPDPFDSGGNTIAFGIPGGISGNITAGQSEFGQTCSGCHASDRGTGYAYPQLSAAISSAPMFLNLTQQKTADLVAYLNRANRGTQCNTTPTPTPTPLDDRSRGRLVYEAGCRSCHGNPREFRSLSRSELDEAIREKPEMRNLSFTEEQYRVLFIYFRSL